MKIIYNPPPVPPPYRFVCSSCKATIEAEETEGKKFTSPKNDDCITFVCPVCGGLNTLVRHACRGSL